jgi:hypothetical protein
VTTPPLPYEEECKECTRLQTAERAARAARNPSMEVDYRVLARRHLREVHGEVTVAGVAGGCP